MITAKNYVAQLLRFFPVLINNAISERDKNTMRFIEQSLLSAVHFVLPDGGKLLDNNHVSLKEQKLHLPYKTITVEYFIKEQRTGKTLKTIILASQEGEYVDSLGFWGTDNYFAMCPIGIRTHPDWSNDSAPRLQVQNSDTTMSSVKGELINILPDTYPETENDIKTGRLHGASNDAYSIRELLEALSCLNISTAIHQEASPKNASRIKDGKLPIYETKMLVVDTKGTFSKTGAYLGGHHASPRQHLRRGHIRRYATGKNIWVQSCVVGDPTKGKINKTYMVK